MPFAPPRHVRVRALRSGRTDAVSRPRPAGGEAAPLRAAFGRQPGVRLGAEGLARASPAAARGRSVGGGGLSRLGLRAGSPLDPEGCAQASRRALPAAAA